MPEKLTQAYTLELAEEHIGDLRGQVTVMNEALTQDDTDVVPNTPAAGSIQYSSGGDQKYVSTDGNAYNTGRLTVPSTGALSLTTGLQNVPGLSAPLAVGNYRIHCQLLVSCPATAGQGVITYKLNNTGGLTASNGRATFFEARAANIVGLCDYTTLGTSITSNVAPGSGGANHLCFIDGYFIISVAGTIAVQASQAATAAASIVQYGTYLDVMPVS